MILLQNYFVQNELLQFIFIAIECSILDIHQRVQGSGSVAEADKFATKARRHEEEAATAMTVVVVKAQKAAAQ